MFLSHAILLDCRVALREYSGLLAMTYINLLHPTNSDRRKYLYEK